MKIWTYKEAVTKIKQDLDLEDETFIYEDEMAGYFNEGISEAESEIHKIDEDYFKTTYLMPVVQGVKRYPLPYNMYANRIRKVLYFNGPLIYTIDRFRRRYEFTEEALATLQPEQSQDYRYTLENDIIGKYELVFYPQMRDTAILYPDASRFFPIYMKYIRNASRIPMIGEFCNPETLFPTQVNIGTDIISTNAGTKTYGVPQKWIAGGWPGSIAYVLADQVQFEAGPNFTLPAPLVEGTTYYAVPQGGGGIKLATSKANAIAGTAIDLTTQGSGPFFMRVAATKAIRLATLIDIPEFTTFVIQWAKVRCISKEFDPRTGGEADELKRQKKQMVDTLTGRVPDDNDEIEADFTHYYESN